MNDVFFANNRKTNTVWFSLENAQDTLKAQWERIFADSGISPNSPSMKYRTNADTRIKKLIKHRNLIQIAKEEIKSINGKISVPFVFILTDKTGDVLFLEAPKIILEKLESLNIGVGTCFSMNCAGINAISVAMEVKRVTAVIGEEHSLRLFFNWSCVCSPIFFGSKIIGYLNLSFSKSVCISFAVPFVAKIVEQIENKYVAIPKDSKNEHIIEMFENYGLTNREKEVALGWLLNGSTLYISQLLGISEETVRTVIKKIYAKTGVRDKSQFIKKFWNKTDCAS